ncbi:hypothetical protein LCGC14_0961480 [marine sediment metagenome]|uniref:HNH nuclease domain-containing protein n=1 Tax=marine sediment metagenome TaxID=412755 RepID=A0A0F9NJ13_9ZZZZ
MNKNREVWQEAHGEIPKGFLVHALNGDKRDIRLENLAAVPRYPSHLGQITAPYIERIRKLELKLKE